MIRDVEIRPATAADIRTFYAADTPHTCYAWAAFYKGELACIAGVTLSRRGCVAFSEVKPGINAPKMTIWRAAKVMFGYMKELKLPMMAIYCPRNPAGEAFIQRLGFVHAYSRDGAEFYKCS